MSHYIDAMGKACPEPLILARQALNQGSAPLTIAVDNAIAVENLKRLASSRGIQAAVVEGEGRFEITFPTAGVAPAVEETPSCQTGGGRYAVFIGKDHLGEGDPTLGYNLLKMFLYTLSQSESIPAYVLFMNSGVKLPAGEEQDVLASLRALAEGGAQLMVCGTCLNYYGIADKLQIGQVSNMYDILSKMQEADKVLTV